MACTVSKGTNPTESKYSRQNYDYVRNRLMQNVSSGHITSAFFPFGCVWSSCKDRKRLAHACRCDTPNSCQVEQAVSCSCNVIMYYIMSESAKHS